MDNKRFVGLLLALVMLFSLGASVAFAQSNNGHSKATFAFGDRDVTKRLSEIKNRFVMNLDDAQKRFDSARPEFDNAKSNWLNSRGRFDSNSLDANSLFPVAKNYLLKATDHLSNYLTVNRAKVVSIESKSGIDVNALIAKIDLQLDDLNSLKVVIKDSNSTAQLKDILPQIKSMWDSAKVLSKETVGYVLAGNTSRLIDKVSGLSDKVAQRMAALDANGVDTNALNVAMVDFNSKIASARTHVLNAVGEFNKMTADANSQGFFKAGQDELKLAHKDLRDATKGLKGSVWEFNSINRDSNRSDDSGRGKEFGDNNKNRQNDRNSDDNSESD